jgi:3-isopropylmalate/(R)-2-methylmalate dehydratase small subunit
MSGLTVIEGRAIPFGRANVDTDMIIAAEHLKTVTRTGLGRHMFETLRGEPGSVFDDPIYAAAPILVAGANFGCGSSREHAVWALRDFGVRAVVAAGFSDIFASNAFKNGVVTVALGQEAIDRLLAVARDHPLRVDMAAMIVTTPLGEAFPFAMDPFRRECLLKGLDEIDLTLARSDAIGAYEARAPLLRWTIPSPAAHG